MDRETKITVALTAAVTIGSFVTFAALRLKTDAIRSAKIKKNDMIKTVATLTNTLSA